MFRLSRLRSPRATFAAFALLAAAMLGFGTLAEISLASAPDFVAVEEDSEPDSEAPSELVIAPDDESWPARSVPDMSPARPTDGFRPIAAEAPAPKRKQTRA